MRRFIKKLFQDIQPGAYLVLACAILMLPIKWIFAWLVASLVHELGHYLCARLCGKRILGFTVNWNGMIIRTEDLGSAQWLCAIAGPFFGLCLILLARWFPRLALCALAQSAINLLPIYPADGGRVLSGVLSLWLTEKTVDGITSAVSAGLVIGLIGAVLYGMIRYRPNLLLLAFLGVLLSKLVSVITSCKQRRLLVQ